MISHKLVTEFSPTRCSFLYNAFSKKILAKLYNSEINLHYILIPFK